MTFTDAAAEVLRLVGKPLHYKDITAYAIEKNLLSHVGKSPEVTMGSRLAAHFKKAGDDNPMMRVRPGVFALREWETSGQLKQMLGKIKGTRTASATSAEEAVGDSTPPPSQRPSEPPVEEPVVAAPPALKAPVEQPPPPQLVLPTVVARTPTPVPPPPPSERPAPPARPEETRVAQPQPTAVQAPVSLDDEEDDEADDRSPDEINRAELAAGAGAMFDEEDDDDQPILGGSGDASMTDRDGSRRRRRRRRRGKGGLDVASVPGSGSLPGYTVSPAFPADASHADDIPVEPRPSVTANGPTHPVVVEVAAPSLDSIPIDDLAGKDMSDAIAQLLGAFDRAAGPVSLRQLAEAAQRRGRLAGDLQMLQSQIAASVRGDNIRRAAQGQRPRFRFTGGRVALTDWLLNGDLPRLEQEALNAVERYRDAARRAFARKAQELPGHAFVELVLLLLERLGLGQIRAVRRAGVPGNEAHFAAIHRTGTVDIQTAIVVRRDGREIGRERVTELRGALHHYGPAAAGWLITAGQVLSGARDEASATNSPTIAVLDGLAVARLCEINDVGVVRTELTIAVPDVDMLEALRSS